MGVVYFEKSLGAAYSEPQWKYAFYVFCIKVFMLQTTKGHKRGSPQNAPGTIPLHKINLFLGLASKCWLRVIIKLSLNQHLGASPIFCLNLLLFVTFFHAKNMKKVCSNQMIVKIYNKRG